MRGRPARLRRRVFCTGVDSCDEGADQCVSSGDPCGDDGEFCTGTESCDEGADQCVSSGNPCDPATQTCNEGDDSCDPLDLCAGVVCDPTGNPCTINVCDPADGICKLENLPKRTPCEDGEFCTVNSSCKNGVCRGGEQRNCDDGQFCTGTESCNEATDTCDSSGDPCDPATQTCNEGTDTCDGGGLCAGVVCDPTGDACTVNVCDSADGICKPQIEPDGTACEDGAFCTVSDSCTGGLCLGGGPRDCDDGLFCTGTETCNEAADTCDSAGNPCDPATQTCNEGTDTCDGLGMDVDIDITRFSVSKKVSSTRGPPVKIELRVRNNGSVDGMVPATVIGIQNGVEVYTETRMVSDPIGDGHSTFEFRPYLPRVTGNISWTATIADDDPDTDVAKATTKVS